MNIGESAMEKKNSKLELLEAKIRKMVREEMLKEEPLSGYGRAQQADNREKLVFKILRKYLDAGKATDCAIQIVKIFED